MKNISTSNLLVGTKPIKKHNEEWRLLEIKHYAQNDDEGEVLAERIYVDENFSTKFTLEKAWCGYRKSRRSSQAPGSRTWNEWCERILCDNTSCFVEGCLETFCKGLHGASMDDGHNYRT